MKIAFVTYDDQGRYASSVENEDTRLLQFLQDKGLDIRFEVWDNPHVSWSEYNLAILKSPWDYFDKIDRFYDWLNQVERAGVRMLNPYNIVRWNADKHYLSDIDQTGLLVTPTAFLEKGQTPELYNLFEALHTERLIIKPCISGGAKNTFSFTSEEVPEITARLHQLLEGEAFMAQPFLPQIQSQGEWSFVFFNGQFSHSLLKKAKPGDFRVQHYLGGTIHTEAPPVHMLASAQAYIQQFAQGCLYARVDGVEVEGEFMLMELELIEPFLFLFTHPQSYENYYQALRELIE